MRICTVCTKPFEGRSNAIYCSDACRNRRPRKHSKATLRKKARTDAARRAANRARTEAEILAATPAFKVCTGPNHRDGLMLPSTSFASDRSKAVPLSSWCMECTGARTIGPRKPKPKPPTFKPEPHGPFGPAGKHPCNGPAHDGRRVWLSIEQFAPSQQKAGGRCGLCCQITNGTAAMLGPLKVPGKTKCTGPCHPDGGEWLDDSAFKPSRLRNSDTRCRDCRRPEGKAYERTRRARKKGATTFPAVEDYIAALYGQPCFFNCGRIADTHEHLVPLARGGAHSEGNIVPACRDCNSLKRDLTLVEFRQFLRGRDLPVLF